VAAVVVEVMTDAVVKVVAEQDAVVAVATVAEKETVN
jgi:hypothetical protein